MQPSLETLMERCRSAKAPDPKLDQLIARAVVEIIPGHTDWTGLESLKFTASFDAATALVSLFKLTWADLIPQAAMDPTWREASKAADADMSVAARHMIGWVFGAVQRKAAGGTI